MLQGRQRLPRTACTGRGLSRRPSRRPLLPPPAVVKFARATGDIHALSTADVRLIALARAFEVAAHGDSSLHELPQLPKVQKKKVHDAKQVSTVSAWDTFFLRFSCLLCQT